MKELMIYEPPVVFVRRKKFNPVKAVLKGLWFPFENSIFGLSLRFYLDCFLKCSVLTGAVIAFIHYKYEISHWDGVYLIAINNLIYPYAKYLFPTKGRFRHYADQGVTVTMTRLEYDRSLVLNALIPYFFAFIFAPAGLLVLFFNNVRSK